MLTNFPVFDTGDPFNCSECVLSWEGQFMGPKLHARSFGASGGPVVWFANSGAPPSARFAVVGAPLDHFKTASQAEAAWHGAKASLTPAWAPGQTSSVASLPAGFTHRVALFAGRHGVTDTLWRW